MQNCGLDGGIVDVLLPWWSGVMRRYQGRGVGVWEELN